MSASNLKIYYVDQKTKHEFHFSISVFKKPSNEKEYLKLEKFLDNLIDEVKGNDRHPLAIVMQIIAENLEQYDNDHHPDIGENVSEVAIVKYLMKSHNLRQNDLADIFGGQANVSKFLNGERPLSKNQILGLKQRFKISADFFIK